MEYFNKYVNIVCIFATISALFLQLIGKRWSNVNSTSSVRNYEFIKFRRQFMTAYLLCLFAFSLQKSYLYYLYQSYGFLENQISLLYAISLLTDAFFQFLVLFLLQRINRKVLCCCFSAFSSISCLLKFSPNFFTLLLSSVADGASSSLFHLAFQEWYRHEHVIDFDFPEEWIPSTFNLLSIVAGYLIVGAGFTAELSEETFKITAFPFFLSIPLLIAGGIWICFKWPSNYLDHSHRRHFLTEWRTNLKLITQKSNLLLLGVAHTFFESAFYLFEFLWTPLFANLMPIYRFRPSFGGLFSTFAAAKLIGLVLAQHFLSRKCSHAGVLSLAAGFGLVGAACAVMAAYPDHETSVKYQVVLAALVLFNVGGGLHASCVERIREEIIPAENRYFVLPLLRFPAFLLSAILLYVVTTAGLLGTWLLLVACLFLMLMCLMTSFALHGTINRQHRHQFVDHFILPLKNSGACELK